MFYYSDQAFKNLSLKDVVSIMKSRKEYSILMVEFVGSLSENCLQKCKDFYLSHSTLLENDVHTINSQLITYLVDAKYIN
jgi:hypothetical protein